MSQEIVETPQSEMLLPVSTQEVVAQVNAIQDLMNKLMKDGEHYGKIPGCGDKPTLLKAGAEKLAWAFRLAPLYDVTTHELDGGHYRYEIKCALKSLRTGNVVAEGVGCCSSKETKYATVRGQARPNLEDVRNTVEKMAAKRALVAAVLNGTAASDIFTQDIEELADAEHPAAQPPPPQRKSESVNGWRQMNAKYNSKCSAVGCGADIKQGQPMYYSTERKAAICVPCHDAPA